MKDNELTQAENHALDLTAALWNAMLLLPPQHPDDIREARLFIHNLQNMIMARPTARAMGAVIRPNETFKIPLHDSKDKQRGKDSGGTKGSDA